jgi:hypothetical protein
MIRRSTGEPGVVLDVEKVTEHVVLETEQIDD